MLFKYIIVGGVNTIIYSSILYYLISATQWNEFVQVGFAYLIAMVFHFTANCFYTFRAKKIKLKSVLKYIVTSFLTYIVSVIVVKSCNYFVINNVITVIVNIACVVPTGFLLSKKWVYL